MTDTAMWRKYLSLLESLGGTLEELTGMEQEKTKAVSKGDLPAVEELMKREQVISLSLRGLEQRRERMLREMELAGVPLRELAGHAPEELYQETKDAAETLRQKYDHSRLPPRWPGIRWSATCGPSRRCRRPRTPRLRKPSPTRPISGYDRNTENV